MSNTRAGLRRLKAAVSGILALRHARGLKPSTLLLFAGNPRSGTTLVRSLLDAHPAIRIGQEWNLLQRFQAGERSWPRQLAALSASAAQFNAAPQWEGYDYRVRPVRGAGNTAIEVIGDKKAGRTLLLLAQHPDLLDALLEWSPIPVRFLHCVRDPFDVIATKTRRNGLSLERNVALYFDLEETAAGLAARLGPAMFGSVYLERIIAAPRDELARLCDFLGVEPIAAHLDAAAGSVFAAPRRTRDELEWPEPLRAGMLRRMAAIPHLSAYAPR